MSLFNYCPLIWMFCCKQAHNLLKASHHRALKARFSDFSSSYTDLLSRSNSVDIHSRNLRLMLEEVFKSIHGLGPPILQRIYTRSGQNLQLPKSARTNSFDFRATIAWNHLPNSVKTSSSLLKFKSNLKKIAIYCQCNACR